jgi:hypothetical protein
MSNKMSINDVNTSREEVKVTEVSYEQTSVDHDKGLEEVREEYQDDAEKNQTIIDKLKERVGLEEHERHDDKFL